MNGLHPAARLKRLLQATPEQLAAVDRILWDERAAGTVSGTTPQLAVAGSGPAVVSVFVVLGEPNNQSGNGESQEQKATSPEPMAAGQAGDNAITNADLMAMLAESRAEMRQGLASLGTNLEKVAKNEYALRKENEELRQLNKEGYFKFAVRVNGEDFLTFAVIMALGNRKAAADHLKIPARTLYHRVDQWPGRGKDYQLMLRYLEWRKRSSRHLKVELNPSLQSGEDANQPENPETMADVLTEIKAADHRDYPALLAEVLQALQRQNSGNWTMVRQELVEMIKDEV